MKLFRTVLILALCVSLAGCGKGCFKSKSGSDSDEDTSSGSKPQVKKKPVPYKVTELASKPVKPSDKTTIEWRNEVKVTVPAGAVKKEQKLSINSVDKPPAKDIKALEQSTVYDISAGAADEFDEPITIELAIDAAKLDPGQPPEASVCAGYWDNEKGLWQIVPVRIDKDKKIAQIRTKHLCAWCLYYRAKGYGIRLSEHFNIIFDPTDSPVIMRENPNQPANPTAQQQDADAFAHRAEISLEAAYLRYQEAGFRMPNVELWEETLTMLSCPYIWVFINVTDYAVTTGRVQESYRSGFTGHIYLTGNFDSVDTVRHECAHELFHAIQNEYCNIVSMGQRYWYADATADYAAERIAWNGEYTGQMGSGIGLRYVEAPVTWVGPENTPYAYHEYQTCHFIDTLVRNGANFRDMWEATMNWGVPLTVLGPMDKYLQGATNRSLGDHYRTFAARILFDPNGPVPDTAMNGQAADVFTNGTQRRDEMPLTRPALDPWDVELPQDLTARVWAVRPEVNRQAGFRDLRVDLLGTAGAGSMVDVYVLQGGRRQAVQPGTPLINKGDFAKASLRDGDVLYVVAVNTSIIRDRNVTVGVSDDTSMLTIAPSEIENAQNKVYDFTARAQNIPVTVKRVECEWEFNDGSDPVSYKYESNLKAGIESKVMHRFQTRQGLLVVATLYDITKDREELARAECMVTFGGDQTVSFAESSIDAEVGSSVRFEAKTENSPDKAAFAWDFGDKASTRTADRFAEHSYSEDGTYKVTVKMLDQGGKAVDEATCMVRVRVGSGKKLEVAYEKYDDGSPYREFQYYWEQPEWSKDPTDKRMARHGYLKEWDEKGQLTTECTYKDRKFDGPFKQWYSNGNKKVVMAFNEDVPEGPFTEYRQDGTPEVSGNYSKGMLEGNCTFYHENGKVYKEIAYKEDKHHGKYIEYYENGQVAIKSNRIGEVNHGEYESYAEDGKPRDKGQFDNGNRTGQWTFWHENGKKSIECQYANNEMNGKYVSYRDDGTIQEEGQNTDGNKNGTWILYDYTGKKTGEVGYKNNQRDGPCAYFNAKEIKVAEGTFKEDEKDGLWTTWDADGEKESSGEYKEDRMVGVWTTWYWANENGKKVRKSSKKDYGSGD
jgi:antitoxin component YwqK of YwqJK toxin-antitoxin module